MELVQKQAQIEQLAEEILGDRQLRINYDRRRHELQEALALFRRGKVEDKVWLHTGGLFVKSRQDEAKETIQQDLRMINEEISRCDDSIRTKTIQLEEAENESHRIKGFNLKGISTKEVFKIKH